MWGRVGWGARGALVRFSRAPSPALCVTDIAQLQRDTLCDCAITVTRKVGGGVQDLQLRAVWWGVDEGLRGGISWAACEDSVIAITGQPMYVMLLSLNISYMYVEHPVSSPLFLLLLYPTVATITYAPSSQ